MGHVALAIKAVSRHWTRRRHHAARRFYERYADHAVNAGHHMFFFITGEQLVKRA